MLWFGKINHIEQLIVELKLSTNPDFKTFVSTPFLQLFEQIQVDNLHTSVMMNRNQAI